MKYEMSREQFFCLRNWAVCVGSLRIRIVISYGKDTPHKTIKLDLHEQSLTQDGLLLIVHPQTDGVGLLCITLDPSWQGRAVTGFRMHLESAGMPLSELHLEYAFADALAAHSYHGIAWAEQPLVHPDLLFVNQDSRITVMFYDAAEKQAAPSETHALQPQEQFDTAGDIAADLRILHFYGGTEAARLTGSLQALQEKLPEMEAAQAAAALAALEEKLSALIERTQSDIRLYREQLCNAD